MQSIAATQFMHSAPPAYQTWWAEQAQLAAEFEALLVGYLTLSNLADDNRWITLVADKDVDLHRIKRSFSRHQRLRIIQAETEDLLWIAWQCLAQGNSQTVIAVLDNVAATERQHLQDAATLGCSTLHLIQSP